jgi:DNA-binding NarL/FixJ family response regulator
VTSRILVVDDSAEWRLLVRSILAHSSSFRVVGEACDGAEAIEKAVRLLPDLVLLDIGMPHLNGIEAAKKIRQTCPDSKIIFLTQENNCDVRAAALATGASAYLLKSQACELPDAIETATSWDPNATREPILLG